MAPDLKTPGGLKQLNEHLECHSYVGGAVPNSDDASSFGQLSSPPAKEYPHLLRWYSHIKSFSNDEKKKWGAGSGNTVASSSAAAADDDDDIDLFGDSDEDEDKEEKERIKQERLEAYAAKKSKKPGPIAKSTIVLDIKPWDDETDLKEVEKMIRAIQADGLVWAQSSKILPVAYGIMKLQIGCVVEDEKIGTDFLEEAIMAFEDHVQSVDVAAFQKI